MQTEETTQNNGSQVEEQPVEGHGLYRPGLSYGYFIYRFRWFIIAFWIIVLGVSVPFAARVSALLNGGGYSFSGSESSQVSAELITRLHNPLAQSLVVFQSSTSAVSDPAYQQEIRAFESRARNFPYTSSINAGNIGKDGRSTFIVLNFNKDFDFMQPHVNDVRALLPSANANAPAHAYLTDQLAIADELTQTSQQDAERADATVLPIALIVLLIVFGTLTAALTPLLLALVAVPTAFAIIYPIAQHSAVSSYVISIISVVGLGISIDYSLFITRRFREELARGRDVRDAVAWSVATAGEAILFSGLTVMIGFLGLFLIGINMTTSQGIGGAAVVACAVIAALTFLPALLSILGKHINSLRIPVLWRLTMPRPGEDNNSGQRSFWHRLALGVMQRPLMVILAVCVILVALGWPIFSLRIGTSGVSILSSTSPARQGFDILHAQFPGLNQNPVDVMAQTPDHSDMLSSANLEHVAHLTDWLATQPHVTAIVSLMRPPTTPAGPTLSRQQLLTLYSTGAYKQLPALAQFVAATTTHDGLTHITLNSDTQLDSSAGQAQIDHLRNDSKEASTGLTLQVGGLQAVYLDFDRYLYSNFPKAILFIVIATFILLMLMFRSLLLPLKAVIVNVLSVSAAYGVLVFVFQWGHLSKLLNFSSIGFVDGLIPILLFCILFGLSMDYEVFLLSRIREEWLRTHDNRLAVARGLEKTGSVITNAALLFVIVTMAFTFTSLIVTKEIGLGMTVAILIDATIIRSLLVPATMRLLGRWNWWFPFVRSK